MVDGESFPMEGVGACAEVVVRRTARELEDGRGEFDRSRSRWKVCGSIETVFGKCISSVILIDVTKAMSGDIRCVEIERMLIFHCD